VLWKRYETWVRVDAGNSILCDAQQLYVFLTERVLVKVADNRFNRVHKREEAK